MNPCTCKHVDFYKHPTTTTTTNIEVVMSTSPHRPTSSANQSSNHVRMPLRDILNMSSSQASKSSHQNNVHHNSQDAPNPVHPVSEPPTASNGSSNTLNSSPSSSENLSQNSNVSPNVQQTNSPATNRKPPFSFKGTQDKINFMKVVRDKRPYAAKRSKIKDCWADVASTFTNLNRPRNEAAYLTPDHAQKKLADMVKMWKEHRKVQNHQSGEAGGEDNLLIQQVEEYMEEEEDFKAENNIEKTREQELLEGELNPDVIGYNRISTTNFTNRSHPTIDSSYDRDFRRYEYKENDRKRKKLERHKAKEKEMAELENKQTELLENDSKFDDKLKAYMEESKQESQKLEEEERERFEEVKRIQEEEKEIFREGFGQQKEMLQQNKQLMEILISKLGN